ncbi:MAG: hypothetical protein Q8Q73_13805 [Stagnimonas sp.]|nr:hypothetical protein [Stagnimonas sp.]
MHKVHATLLQPCTKVVTGWPTFPMLFTWGRLVSGANDLEKRMQSVNLKKLLG